MSERGKYERSPETIAKMSAAQKGKQNFLGRRHTPETKAKIGLANRGRIRSDGYWAIHKWMRENFVKTGVCEICGKIAGARSHDFANLRHVYTRNRDDWKELCRSCHKKHDAALKKGVMP